MRFGQVRYADENELLNIRFEEKQVLIAAHRGSWRGNIIQNTTGAYRAALRMGADVVETDTSVTADGVVYSIHDGTERELLDCSRSVLEMTSEEIDAIHPLNALMMPSTHKIQRLEEVFAFLTHGELLNIDRSWKAGGLVPGLLDRYPHMKRQALLKAPLRERDVIEQLHEHPVKYMFMPICSTVKDVDEALKYPELNVVGAELIASKPEDELFSDDAIAYIHSRGLFTWVNALTLTDFYPEAALYGELDDDISVLEEPSRGWGRLMDKGIDVIQTDWPSILRDFRKDKLGR